jgi:hypothetical protein
MQSKQDRHRSRGAADHAGPDGPRLRGTACRATMALLGTLRDDPRSRAEFFALARGPASPEPA